MTGGEALEVATAIGWLEAFEVSVWALVEVQEKEIVSPETAAEYAKKVARLRVILLEVKS